MDTLLNRLVKIIKRCVCGGNQEYVPKSTFNGLLFAWDEKVLVLIYLYVHVVSCFSGKFSTLLIFSFTSECLLPAVMQWFVILSSPHSNGSRLYSHLRIKETQSHTEIMIKTGLWRFIFPLKVDTYCRKSGLHLSLYSDLLVPVTHSHKEMSL